MLAKRIQESSGKVIFLTGAGISAESGIPTFRGGEGYWTVGSQNYHPQELATHHAFSMMPETVWDWYLYRRRICRGAAPNEGHTALVALEMLLGSRFLLITQNVDGLHLRAGNGSHCTHEIHGNIDYFRCSRECRPARHLIQEDAIPSCPFCGAMGRPHVLWFDECYNEENYFYESSRAAARQASALISIGTSGQTNLPNQMAQLALTAGALLIDINPDRNPFSDLALSRGGQWLKGSASEGLQKLLKQLIPGGT